MTPFTTLPPALPPIDDECAPQRRSFVKRASAGLDSLSSLAAAGGPAAAHSRRASPTRSATLSELGRPPADADTFSRSPAATMRKVRVESQYQMDVAANPFAPNEPIREGSHAAIIVGHPMGAVTEQTAASTAPRPKPCESPLPCPTATGQWTRATLSR